MPGIAEGEGGAGPMNEEEEPPMKRSVRLRVRLGLALFCAYAGAWAARPVSALAESKPLAGPAAALPNSYPFPVDGELSADALVAVVLERNPSLAQMAAAAEAAAARYPQAISLEDPMLGVTVSPRTFSSQPMDGGYRVELSQKYPWPGKLRLRGENAAAEARAAEQDVEDMRLQLIESARDAFADYYLAGRGLEVSRRALELLEGIQSNQESLFKTGKIPPQDLLQTKVEVGRQQERQLTLERMLQTSRARINTLLHLPPNAPLPPAPEHLPTSDALPDEGALRAAALVQRPDLKALAEHVAAEQAALALAHKEYRPDFEVMAAYDDFWSEPPLRAQLGVRLNLPVRASKRDAAVREAEARVSQRVAELNRRTDDVNYAVDQAYAEATESDKIVALYKNALLPPAELNVQTLQTQYTTNKTPFINLLDAERNLIDLRDRNYQALADAFRRRSALERSVGGPLEQTLPVNPLICAPRPALHPLP